MNPLHTIYPLMLRSGQNTGLAGPLPSALVKTLLLGPALGYGAGYLANLNQDKRTRHKKAKNWALTGGIGGAGWGLADMYGTHLNVQRGYHPEKSTWKAMFSPAGVRPNTTGPQFKKKSMYALGKQAAFSYNEDLFPDRGGHINTGTAISTVMSDPTLDPVQKAQGLIIVNKAAENESRGLITTGDVIRGAVGAGLGLGAGVIAGKSLGALFTLPANTQKVLAGTGAVGGLLKATGVWK